MTADLRWKSWDTGGGCMAYLATTTTGHLLGLSDGRDRLPTTTDRFVLGLMTELGEPEIYSLTVDGQTVSR